MNVAELEYAEECVWESAAVFLWILALVCAFALGCSNPAHACAGGYHVTIVSIERVDGRRCVQSCDHDVDHPELEQCSRSCR